MKKLLLPVFCLALLSTGCGKEDKNCPPVTTTAPAAEIATLKSYITNSSITATEDPRGFYYSITTPGTGDKPSPCNDVTVNYSGKLTNGTQFDAGNAVTFTLSGLIVGWQEGIPLIAKGGRIVLYLPPSLAYGSQANGSIPANSILIFTIDLLYIS